MYLARVIGSLVASAKESNISGRRLLVVRRLSDTLADTACDYVCVDSVSARSGDIVLTCASSSARLAAAAAGSCTDNAIVAIVDRISSAKADAYVRR